jgi:hypothetical protein
MQTLFIYSTDNFPFGKCSLENVESGMMGNGLLCAYGDEKKVKLSLYQAVRAHRVLRR